MDKILNKIIDGKSYVTFLELYDNEVIMYNRYYELKNIYKKYIIFIKSKNRYKTFDVDNDITRFLDFKKMRYFKKYKINYIILDNLEIAEKYECEDNKYDEYLLKTYLKILMKKIDERMIS